MSIPSSYTAFEGLKIRFQGSLGEVVIQVKKRLGKSEHSPVLIISDLTGKVMDFNFHGTLKDVQKRLEVFVSQAEEGPKDAGGPGRPKLGVISREVSLLPRHWEWLASQSGGASAALRKLVEDAKRQALDSGSIKEAQARTYKFMSVIAGDLQGYEEALRALYRRDGKKFQTQIEAWPSDVQKYIKSLAQAVFS